MFRMPAEGPITEVPVAADYPLLHKPYVTVLPDGNMDYDEWAMPPADLVYFYRWVSRMTPEVQAAIAPGYNIGQQVVAALFRAAAIRLTGADPGELDWTWIANMHIKHPAKMARLTTLLLAFAATEFANVVVTWSDHRRVPPWVRGCGMRTSMSCAF